MLRNLLSVLFTSAMPIRERRDCVVEVVTHFRDRRVIMSAWYSTALAWRADIFN